MSVLWIHNSSGCDLIPLSLVLHLSLTLRTQHLFVSTSLRVSILDLDVSLLTHVTLGWVRAFSSPPYWRMMNIAVACVTPKSYVSCLLYQLTSCSPWLSILRLKLVHSTMWLVWHIHVKITRPELQTFSGPFQLPHNSNWYNQRLMSTQGRR